MYTGLSASGQGEYEKWRAFLFDCVPFLREKSYCHAKDHCARVLLFSLRIAEAGGLSLGEREVLSAACVFHDCCRLNDDKDVGHGQRAAERYRSVCGELGLPFDERVYFIMAYHDRHDGDGEEAIRSHFGAEADGVIRLYHIFKDADALDRFRFGPHELDETYLRTAQARSLVAFAKEVNEAE